MLPRILDKRAPEFYPFRLEGVAKDWVRTRFGSGERQPLILRKGYHLTSKQPRSIEKARERVRPDLLTRMVLFVIVTFSAVPMSMALVSLPLWLFLEVKGAWLMVLHLVALLLTCIGVVVWFAYPVRYAHCILHSGSIRSSGGCRDRSMSRSAKHSSECEPSDEHFAMLLTSSI